MLPGLLLRNSTFCAQSAFMYFVYRSGQTAITALGISNSLVSVTVAVCVYCEVRTQWNLRSGGPPRASFSFIHLFTIHRSNIQSQKTIGCGFGQNITLVNVAI